MIPIGTSVQLSRRPTANIVLIALNSVVFLAPLLLKLLGQPSAGANLHRLMESYMLHSSHPQLHEFITYAFLHAGWMHILGNMVFLLIFGNNVNDRLGNTGYLLLYLGGAIFAGFGHVLVSTSPVLGASGAVAAITGAYFVLFPKTEIRILWTIILITTFDVPAFYFVLVKLIILDNLIAPEIYGSGGVAHGAHLAGYLFGIAVPMALLALKLLPHSHFDLWAVMKRWQRRQPGQPGAYQPFGMEPPTDQRKFVFAKVRRSVPSHPQSEQITELRSRISQAMLDGELITAAKVYQELLDVDANQTMPEQSQLDIANKLMQESQHSAAAQAYELFLENYTRYPFREQIQLMLGLLYSRYLSKPDLAQKNLQGALEKLRDSGQRQMCQDELDRID
jgi:membrane associated rhomboid family serine protease